MTAYDPKTVRLRTFFDAAARFRGGAMTPRDYLEDCLETIEAREPEVRAFVVTNIEGARAAADAATERFADNKPLSWADGMPVGIKDLYETVDMPTQMGSEFYEGWQSHRDAAHVYALRRAGAVIVGKTVTTELGMARPGPTRNPFDSRRTPGGSSSGSAAAIGAAMLPVAVGSQARGSIIRPASYCGNFAIKPTWGSINKGGGSTTSPSLAHIGTHAGSLEDMWRLTHFMSHAAGPEPSQPGLFGRAALPAAQRPRRLVRLEMEGWEVCDEKTRDVFDQWVQWLSQQDVEILDRRNSAEVVAYEEMLKEVAIWWRRIAAFEIRWPHGTLRDRDPSKIADWIIRVIEQGEQTTLEEYREALAWRDRLRTIHANFVTLSDGFFAPAAPGPAPVGADIGDAVYNEPSSLLGVPTINLPALALENVPQGIQFMGYAHQDERITAVSRWVWERWAGDTA